MKKKSWRGLVAVALVSVSTFLSACIPSLQPPYSEKDLFFEPALIGSWSEKDDSAVWTFAKANNQSYEVTIKDKDESSPLIAHLFKVNGQLYLDLYPADKGFEDWKREAFFKSAVIPAHIFFKVGEIGTKFTFYALQSDWLKELLQKNPQAVAHSKLAEDRVVFTGSTEEMRKFLQKFEGTKEAWGDPAIFTRR
jgi:hypothetical protein